MNFLAFILTSFYVFYSNSRCILVFSPYGKSLLSFVYVFIYCVAAEITTLMSISDGSDPFFFRRKMEKMRSVKEKMDGGVLIFRQIRHIFLL